ANPDDDMPRLVYADFLEESGLPVCRARAEFIRLQCEAVRLSRNDPRFGLIRQREEVLLAAYIRKWNGPAHRRLQAGPLRGQLRRGRGLGRSWRYRRGFITEVTAHVTVAIQHFDELVKIGPLEALRLWGVQGQLPALLASGTLRRIRELDFLDTDLSSS